MGEIGELGTMVIAPIMDDDESGGRCLGRHLQRHSIKNFRVLVKQRMFWPDRSRDLIGPKIEGI